jgi:hypothetical protein
VLEVLTRESRQGNKIKGMQIKKDKVLLPFKSFDREKPQKFQKDKVLEMKNLINLQNINLTYKNHLYFQTAMINYLKKKLRNQSHLHLLFGVCCNCPFFVSYLIN